MMKTLIKIAAIVLLFIGCAVPAPIIKLSPSTVENKDYWNQGQQFVYATDNNVWFDCAFNRIENNKLIFDVKIVNKADSATLVDPAKFVQQVYANDSLKVAERTADDPESVLLYLNIQENLASAESKNAATVGICSAILLTGVAVAVVASNKNECRKENTNNNSFVSDVVASTVSSAIAQDVDSRAGSNWVYRKSLAEAFLRKTTLAKDFYIDGEVHFPYYPTAKWYRLVFSSGNSKADFLFKQLIIYPDSAYRTPNYQ